MKPTCLNCRNEVPIKQWLTLTKPHVACQACGFQNKLKPGTLIVSVALLLVLIAMVAFLVYGYTQDQFTRGGVRLLLGATIAIIFVIWGALYYFDPLKS